jgi:predicted metalloprotease with PDZ domain
MTARLEITYPAAWSLACALPVAPSPSTAHVDDGGQGAVLQRTALLADDLDHVVDSPCLLGTLVRLDWTVGRVPHSAVLDGLASVPVPATLVDDLKKIVERTASIFGGELPYQRYVFLCLFAADGHGGLEHSESTTLLMSRTAIATPKGYRDFLSLAAHEHFHAWNAKRMRPVEFWTYDYERENYTELLWLIEGWTAYYDDLICHRAGLISREDYLGIVAKNVNTMLAAPGRHHLSLSESSFDAWIRLYRPDENSRNSSQNYYGNGAVAAMCLDLLIRRRTSGAASLDDIVRTLYASTFAHGRGYTADDIARIVATVAGADVVTALTALVSDRLDPELNSLVAAFGLRVVSTGADKPYLGITFDAGRTTIAAINLDSPAYRSGLSPGDEVLAIAGLRVDGDRWAEVFQAVARIDHPLEVLVARRGVIARRVATPTSSPPTISIEIDPVATAGQTALRDGWLPAAC